MTAVDASNRSAWAQTFVTASPPAPAQVGPGGVVGAGQRHRAPPQETPPVPPEPELSRIPVSVEDAVKMLQEVQGDLIALENSHPPPSETALNTKKHEKMVIQDWAIKVATEQLAPLVAEDKQADDLRQKSRSDFDKLSKELPWNPRELEKTKLKLLELSADQADTIYQSVHARLLNAEGLLEQAKLTPKGELIRAEDNFQKAKKRDIAAELKLTAVTSQPGADQRIVGAAQKELATAEAEFTAATREVEDAAISKAWYARYGR
jgi:hypothetical protein